VGYGIINDVALLGDRCPQIQAIITNIFLYRSSSVLAYHPDSGVLMVRQLLSLSLVSVLTQHNDKQRLQKRIWPSKCKRKYELFTVVYKGPLGSGPCLYHQP
jgi:hypothetical protein